MATDSVLNCKIAKKYPADPEPLSETRCEVCGLNAFDTAFVAAQVLQCIPPRKVFCCAAAVITCGG
jgi:hypothetical protein